MRHPMFDFVEGVVTIYLLMGFGYILHYIMFNTYIFMKLNNDGIKLLFKIAFISFPLATITYIWEIFHLFFTKTIFYGQFAIFKCMIVVFSEFIGRNRKRRK